MRYFTTRRGALFGSALLLGGCATQATQATEAPPGASDAAPGLAFDPLQLPEPAAVLAVLNYTADAQISALEARTMTVVRGNLRFEPGTSWIAAAFYVGASRLARVSDDVGIISYLSAVADHFNYAHRGARNPRTALDADELAVGDLYQELYALRRQPTIMAALHTRLEYILPHLTVTPAPQRLVWWWCDALFMAPPVLARMSALTGDPRYLEAMDVQWKRAHARLFDTAENMYCRDERFIARRSASGAKIFWSRGQGWVFAGLVRVLESMPADFHNRGFYLDTFRRMAERIAGLQHDDGLWRASLLDPEAFQEPENSGSAFFTYGLAWGINHGLLDRATYLPHVLRGWAGLTRYILPNGLLGSVQRAGDQPVPTRPQDTHLYGTGALLLAGVEIMRLSAPATALPIPEVERDANDTYTNAPMFTPRPPTNEAERIEAARRDAEFEAVRVLAYDPELGR